MEILVSFFLFIVSATIIWFFSGLLIEAVDVIARSFNKSGFFVAFFILGFLTSIGEISVAVNATLSDAPQIAVGNLVGASFVIILLIIPLLAFVGNGIALRHTVAKRTLLIALLVIVLPALLVMDGDATRMEALLALSAYVTLLFAIRNQPASKAEVKDLKTKLLKKKQLVWYFSKIIIGAILIFFAGNVLVEQSIYFADLLSVPKSLIGLTLLSIGTNIPEIVIAVRAILNHQQGIAFGDYLGSAVANTPLFALLVLANGSFALESSEFIATSILMVGGFALFYIFAGSKDLISRREGQILLLFYAGFILIQIYNLARFAG